jgi:uncharacterized protein
VRTLIKTGMAIVIISLVLAAPAGAGLFENGMAAYQRGDYANALRLWLPLAERGDAGAQNNVGIMYSSGQGVPRNAAVALNWFRKSANQGNANAQAGLGFGYSKGEGVPQDNEAALGWFRKAADQGSAIAQNEIGYSYAKGKGIRQDDAAAVTWFRKAANQGNADGQNNLGFMSVAGRGVSQDYAAAVSWFRKAAAQGHANAQNSLGQLYANGEGVPRDDVTAVSWFRKAADQGLASGQFELGKAYYNGQGVQQDFVTARMWFILAAAGGDEEAAEGLRAIDAKMTPAQIAEAHRRAIERQPKLANASPVPSPQAVQPPQVAQPAPQSKTPEPKMTAGTGFYVSSDGRVITNSHVVESCRLINVISGGQSSVATVVGRDEKNDLALVATGIHPIKAAHWRFQVRQGEDVVVYGFPLAGVLASGGNVATGNVTALAGLGNDSRFLQISAPVQPGNSGGPLFDRNGNVVGVVVSKLNAVKVAELTGDIPQNINFAIKASVVAAFLEAHRVEQDDEKAADALSTPDIADRASEFTVQLICTQ